MGRTAAANQEKAGREVKDLAGESKTGKPSENSAQAFSKEKSSEATSPGGGGGGGGRGGDGNETAFEAQRDKDNAAHHAKKSAQTRKGKNQAAGEDGRTRVGH